MTAYEYRAYGAAIASAFPLPQLVAAPAGRPEIWIRQVDHPVPDGDWQWNTGPGFPPAHAPWLQLGRAADGYRMRFAGGADFLVSRDVRTVTAFHAADLDPDTGMHLLLDQVMPLVLSRLRRSILHAGAFVAGGRAAALIGPSGAGKSTLTASFARAGFPVLADDALAVEWEEGPLMGLPAYPGVRVWPGSLEAGDPDDSLPRVAGYTTKRRLGEAQGLAFAAAPAPLDRIYLLEDAPASEVRIHPLAGREAALALVRHMYVFDPADPADAAAQFDRVAEIARRVRIAGLAYPRRLDMLPAVRAALLADLERP